MGEKFIRKFIGIVFVFFLFSFYSCKPKIYPADETTISNNEIEVDIIVSGTLRANSSIIFVATPKDTTVSYLYSWDVYGSGVFTSYSPNRTTSAVYSAVNNYTLKLRVKNLAGSEKVIEKIITISEAIQPLSCKIFYAAERYMTGSVIKFYPEAKGGETGTYTYNWDWDNNGTYEVENSTGIELEHVFSAGGTITVKLTVSDGTTTASAATVLVIENPGDYLIIYDRDNNVYKMYQDGSSEQLLSPGKSPSCSYLGDKIAFVKEYVVNGHPVYKLSIMDKMGNNPARLTSDEAVSEPENNIFRYNVDDAPVISHNNGKIIFKRSIKTIRVPDTIPGTKFTAEISTHLDNLGLIADKLFLLSVYIFNTGTQIYNLNTTITLTDKLRILSILEYIGYLQNNNLITNAANGIWMINANGTGLQQISTEDAKQFAWKHDDSLIAFVRNGNIYTMDVSGGSVQLLLANAESPGFHPDGTKTAFSKAVGSTAKSIFYAPLSDTTLLTRMTYAGVDEGGTGYDDILLGWGHSGDRFIYCNFLVSIAVTRLPSGVDLIVPLQIKYYLSYLSSMPVGNFRTTLGSPIAMNSMGIMKNK